MTSKNKWAAALMFLVGALIFAWESRHTNFHQLYLEVRTLNWFWLLVGALVMFLSWVVETWVLQIMVHSKQAHLPFKEAIRVPLVEQLFNAITPFATGGQPAQLFAMLQSGIEGGRASSVLLMKFIVYQFMVLINFVLTMVVGFERIAAHVGPLASLIVFGMTIHVFVIIGLLLVMYYYNFTKKLVGILLIPVGWFVGQEKRQELDTQLAEKIDTFYEESLHLKQEKWKVIKACALTLVQLMLYYSVPYFVLLSLHVTHVDIIRVMVLHVMIVMIVSLFPIPGGAGGAEYSFKSIFATYVVSQSRLVLAMMLWRFLTYYMGMIAGIIAVVMRPKPRPIKSTSSDPDVPDA